VDINPKAELLLMCHLQWVNFFEALYQGPVGHSMNNYINQHLRILSLLNQHLEKSLFFLFQVLT
jgi:hypothetical protein